MVLARLRRGRDLLEVERRNESNDGTAWAFPWGVAGEGRCRERRGGTWVCREDQLSSTGGVKPKLYRLGGSNGRVGLMGVEGRQWRQGREKEHGM